MRLDKAPTRTELRDSTSRWENSIKQGVLRHTPEKKTTCQQSRLRPEPARADHWRPKLAAAGRTRGGPATQREQPCVHQISARASPSIALVPDSGAGVQLAQRSPQQRRRIQRRASVVPQRVVGSIPHSQQQRKAPKPLCKASRLPQKCCRATARRLNGVGKAQMLPTEAP